MKKLICHWIYLYIAFADDPSDYLICQQSSAPNKIYTENNPSISIATYNIASGVRNHHVNLEDVARAVSALNADIVGLQEVKREINGSGWYVDQAKELANRTGMYYAFGKALNTEGGGEYGVALLSRHQIEVAHTLHLPSGYHEPRVLLIAQINVTSFDSPIYFFTSHFDYHHDNVVKLQQAQYVNSVVNDDIDLDNILPNLVTGIKLFGGDINSTPEENILTEFSRFWNVVRSSSEEQDYRTWPSGNPAVCFDYLMTGKAQKWEVVEFVIPNHLEAWRGINWRLVSDHLPVVTKLKLLEQ